MEITGSLFLFHTGYSPVQDDLERANCSRGDTGPDKEGHTFCGWCAICNLPHFDGRCRHWRLRLKTRRWA